LNAYNHAHHQKRHARSTKKRNAHQKQTPDHKHKHEQTSSKICTTKQMPRHQTPPPPHRQQQSPAPDKIGTDYRYAVEFSKNGRALLLVLKTASRATRPTLPEDLGQYKPPGSPGPGSRDEAQASPSPVRGG